jgi:hypothetical protein
VRLPLTAPYGECARAGCSNPGRFLFDDDPDPYCSEACYLAARRSAAEEAAYARGYEDGATDAALSRTAGWLTSFPPGPERVAAWLGLVGELEAEAGR